jgi:hypothetical protein
VEDARDVVARPLERAALLVVARPEASLDAAADALERRRRDHAFGRAADAHQQVDARLRLRGGDRGRDVAVADQLHLRARLAQLGDQRVVALPLEHDDGHVARRAALRLGDAADVLGRRERDVDRVDRLRAGGDLLHVDGRAGEEHRAAVRERDHRDRARLAERGQARALERVDGDVARRPVAGADLLAVVEHRRLVLLALADDDDPVHRHGVEHQAHAVDGGLVGGLLVAAADPAPGAQRACLGDADELERDVAVGRLPVAHRAILTRRRIR